MNNTTRSMIKNLEEKKGVTMKGNPEISNIGFSTREQLIKVLESSDNGDVLPANIFLDHNLEYQQLQVAISTMGLLNSQALKINIILPEEYNDNIEGLEKSHITTQDFENLFQKFGQNTYINYQDAIDQLGIYDAYKYIEMYLARKEFMNTEIHNEIIIQSGYVKGLNGIFTRGEVDERVNRNNLLIKTDYNQNILDNSIS